MYLAGAQSPFETCRRPETEKNPEVPGKSRPDVCFGNSCRFLQGASWLTGSRLPDSHGIIHVRIQRLKLGDSNQSFWEAHDNFEVAPHRLYVPS